MKSKPKNQAGEIKAFILANVGKYPESITKKSMDHFLVSRTTINRHINALVKNQQLIQSGVTKDIRYILPDSQEQSFKYPINHNLDEFIVFNEHFSEYLGNLSSNLEDVLSYVVTEMINNVKDHSQGKMLQITWQRLAKQQNILIQDDGIGIFEKLAKFCKVVDKREAILHLSKGKLTTDPANHTGEGIFFSSKIVDEFSIAANGLKYIRNNVENDWLVLSTNSKLKGTTIKIIINNNPKQKLIKIFKKFQKDESLLFNITEIKVDLSKFGTEKYISRSQAKRVLVGLEKFDIIILDFNKVRMVGQGFVDEIFRVYKNRFPDKKIKYINTNSDVLFMIQRSI
jgi:hypothetical protein